MEQLIQNGYQPKGIVDDKGNSVNLTPPKGGSAMQNWSPTNCYKNAQVCTRCLIRGATVLAKAEQEPEWTARQALRCLRKELMNEKELNVMENNHVHLCNSCCNSYPECADDEHAVEFDDGIGNDNICCCNKYEPLMEHDYDRGGYK